MELGRGAMLAIVIIRRLGAKVLCHCRNHNRHPVSGKSTLMNLLFGRKTSGFSVGHYMDPQTMGFAFALFFKFEVQIVWS